MKNDKICVSVIGLGYVGLPVAVAMARSFKTVGYDLKKARVKELQAGIDRTGEIHNPEDLKHPNLTITDRADDLARANFHIIAVPTPVDDANQPDLSPVIGATETVAKFLKKGDIVVYESTVYPGCTEEDCLPILEKISGLKGGIDFKIGYSPERINPGDKEHTFTKIKKVVSGQDAESLETVAFVYGSVVQAGVFRAASIKVAEAAKVIENTQRDLNIALMNELAFIFDRMDIDTLDVLEASSSKWNFLRFQPGLVGGHCIGVDPYYLTHKAERLGYIPQVILAGRRINDSVGQFIAKATVKEMVRAGHSVFGSKATVLGLTFKENCPDIRNSKVIDIIRELKDFGVDVQVCDPLADPDEAHHEYGVELVPLSKLSTADVVVAAVAHNDFRKLEPTELCRLMKKNPVVIDVKCMYSKSSLEGAGIRVWRL